MIYLLIFYITFSEFFMLGYVHLDGNESWWVKILGSLLLVVTAPIMFPYNLGRFIYDNQNY